MNDIELYPDAENTEAPTTGEGETAEEAIAEDRPFLFTSFSDYTVSEGLLLLVLFVLILSAALRVIKEAFSWL